MFFPAICLQLKLSSKTSARLGAAACCGALALGLTAYAQQPAPAQQLAQQAAQAPPTDSPAAGAQAAAAPGVAQPAPTQATTPETGQPVQQPPDAKNVQPAKPPEAVEINEDDLKRLLVGKPLFLRGFYLDNTLSFDEHGQLIGHSPQGSYTLCAVQIDKVHLIKRKVELEGARYGLHFLGQLAYEDPSSALDRVRITPKKKVVKITIDRELVVAPKKKKEKTAKSKAAAPAAPAANPAAQPSEPGEADQLEAVSIAAPAVERPADLRSGTTTSPAHASKLLKDALDRIFAPGMDDRMMVSLPDFWKLYYQAAAAKTDYRPSDPSVLRQNTVDQKAVLLTRFEPESNEYAQANAVAGMALYHTVVGADGKPGEIAVGRPIGFGLDENAVDAIRKATFQPAVKDGKPVPVLLDLVVQFRIFSKRTAVAGKPEPADKPAEPVLPGPYSLPNP